ncbi:MAG: hypothetical protein ACR2OL_00670 [Anderseniella sp.]
MLRAVPDIVEDEGFQLNSTKTRIMLDTSRQVVTGVVVNRRLNVPRKAFDRLKAVIPACGRPDDARLNDPVLRTSLIGQIDWLEGGNPQRGQKLLRLLDKATAKQG